MQVLLICEKYGQLAEINPGGLPLEQQACKRVTRIRNYEVIFYKYSKICLCPQFIYPLDILAGKEHKWLIFGNKWQEFGFKH
jgi:hypothetical protein